MSDTIIIGAGPAGLTAAYELSKSGMSSTILEADEQVGGLSRTVNYKGYRFDIGGHRFFTKVPYIQKLWEDILGDDFLLRSRLSRIHYRGKFFDYPLKAGNALANLGALEAFLVGMSYVKTQLSQKTEERNFEEWVSNRFGERLYRIFFKTYTEKVWGIPCREISADWAAQRIKNLSLSEALRNALLSNGQGKNGRIITTLVDQFHYPRLGPGMMWERCEELLTTRGVHTSRGLRVAKIRHRNGRVESVCAQTGSGESLEFGVEQLISTMPISVLIESLDPVPPDKVMRAANGLRHRDYLTVILIVKREAVFPDNWIYVHSPEVRMGRVQNYKNWSAEMVPDPMRTSLGLEYFLWDRDREWHWSKEQLIELGVNECAQLRLIEPEEIEDGTVIRMKKAYPIYDHGYRRNLATVRQYLESFSNLQTIGRNGLHRYNNQDHSMLTGVYAARNLLGANYDVWSVNTEMEHHEADVEDTSKPTQRGIPVRDETLAAVDQEIQTTFAPLDRLALGISVGLVCGLGIFLATVFLLLKGGEVIGPNLSLLAHYFLGFKVTWSGAFIGLLEAGFLGFVLGHLVAGLRNWGMRFYARRVQQRVESEARRDLLEKV